MFGFRLRVPASGDDITADWARELVKAVRSLRLHAGPGIRLTRTPDGTTISAPSSPSAEAPRDAAIHFGDAEDASEAESWSVANETPGILNISDVDGNVLAKILVDSRGNIVSWGVADEDGEPDDPTPPKDPPPCGNPINDVTDADDNPLEDSDDGPGGGGGGGGDPQGDYNPLDYEGPGGYTPECGKAA